MEQRKPIIRPGIFSVNVPADTLRREFDCRNEVIVNNEVPVDFLFIGDSITYIWEFEAYFQKSGKLILNRGIGGDTSEYLLKRFEADALQLHPKYVVLLIGANDALSMDGEPQFGRSGVSANIIYENVIRNISATLNMAQKYRQKMVLCSILPMNMPWNKNNVQRNELILKINQWIKDKTKENDMIYVDYHSNLTEVDGKTLIMDIALDGAHLHVLGYNILAKVLRETLAQHEIEI